MRGSIAEINLPTALNLLQLARSFTGDVVFFDAELGGQLVVEDHLRIGSVHDRPERELGLPGHSDLADQDDVERGVELLGDLETNRHTAARQGEHDRLFVAQMLQPPGKLAARRSPIGEHGSTLLDVEGFAEGYVDTISTAKALGPTIPPGVLDIADEVIE